MKPRVLVGAALVVLLAVGTARADDIDAYFERALRRLHAPGAAVAVIKDGQVIKAEAYGLANLEHGVPAETNTVFEIGSVSKQFIAAGIMLLVQDGLVDLDDPVGRHLDGTPDAWQAITLRHLLTHTSGLVREAPGFEPLTVQDDRDVIATAYSLPLEFAPGERWEYSNLGYFVLADIIRSVSRMPWADFMTERIFEPLGMTATQVTTLDIVPHRASGYQWVDDRLLHVPDLPAVRPSGAFLSTVLDLARWELALRSNEVLDASSKAEMWTSVTLNSGERYPYGLGWMLVDWPADYPQPTGVPMIQHTGTIGGFRAGFARWPSHDLTVIVLVNQRELEIAGMLANVAIGVVPELRTVPAESVRETEPNP